MYTDPTFPRFGNEKNRIDAFSEAMNRYICALEVIIEKSTRNESEKQLAKLFINLIEDVDVYSCLRSKAFYWFQNKLSYLIATSDGICKHMYYFLSEVAVDLLPEHLINLFMLTVPLIEAKIGEHYPYLLRQLESQSDYFFAEYKPELLEMIRCHLGVLSGMETQHQPEHLNQQLSWLMRKI